MVEFLLNRKICTSLMDIEEALRVSFLAGQEGTSNILINSYLKQAGGGEKDLQIGKNWLLEAVAQVGFTKAMSELAKGPQASPLSTANSFKLVHAAIRKNRIDIIRNLIQRTSLPADVIATAALFGMVEIINLCSDKGYSVEAEGSFGTPLRCASLMGHENTVYTLVSCGANVNAISLFGDALQAASMKGHISITKILIRLRANVNNTGGFFGTAIQAAAYRGHRDVVEALFDAGADIRKIGRFRDAFHAAVEAGQEIVVKFFIDKGYHYPIPEGGFFVRSAGPTTIDGLRVSGPGLTIGSWVPCSLCSDPESKSQTQQNAAQMHHISKLVDPKTTDVYRLGEIGADFDRGLGLYPAREVLTPPINRPVNPAFNLPSISPNDYNALETASSRGHLGVVKSIIAARKRIGIHQSHLGYALWAASTYGYPEIAKCIAAVEVNLRSFTVGSLERAAINGHMEIVDILVQSEDDWGDPSTKEMAVPNDDSWPQKNSTMISSQRMVSSLQKVYTRLTCLLKHPA